MTRALVQLTLLRYREFIREPEAIFWALLFPILLTVGLGVAFRQQAAQTVRIAVTDAALAGRLRHAKLIDALELDSAAAAAALRNGKVTLVVERGHDAGVVYHYDDTNPDGRTARAMVDDALQRAAGRHDPVLAADNLIREPGSRYVDFLVPGLAAMGIMSNAIWGMAFSIVDARRRKLLKRIVATPMPRHAYLLSYLAWRLTLLVFEVGVPIGFGMLVFGVPMRGSWITLALISLLGSLTFSSLGLLISTRIKTIEAASGITNLVVLPMWVVSGVFFSSQRFPAAVQPAIQALPLTAMVDAMRANMLQGAGLADVARQAAVLGAWLLICFPAAWKLFRWR
jgi:ABC-type polysaccharide/polyol phosphate export permease